MPFPLAHPAAVLPLRRFCPRLLSFPALVIGSVVPDAGYLFDAWGFGKVSHHAIGLLTFALPMGALLLWVTCTLGRMLIPVAPSALRGVLSETFDTLVGHPVKIGLSLLLGAATHLLWDSFTHQSGWLTKRVDLLHLPLAHYRGGKLLVCDILWYASTVLGVGCLAWAYQSWRLPRPAVAVDASLSARVGGSVFLALLTLPVAATHRFAQSLAWDAALAAATLLLLIAFVAKRSIENL